MYAAYPIAKTRSQIVTKEKLMSEEFEAEKESFFNFLPKDNHEFYRMLLDLETTGQFRVRPKEKSFNIDYLAGKPVKFIEIEAENNEQKGRAYFYLADLNKVNPDLAERILDLMNSTNLFEESSSQYPMNRRHYPSEGVSSDIVQEFRTLFSSETSRSASIVHVDPTDDVATRLLKVKKQIILYGPPGSGKTYSTKELAVRIITGND
jgi:hypothetical protein